MTSLIITATLMNDLHGPFCLASLLSFIKIKLTWSLLQAGEKEPEGKSSARRRRPPKASVWTVFKNGPAICLLLPRGGIPPWKMLESAPPLLIASTPMSKHRHSYRMPPFSAAEWQHKAGAVITFLALRGELDHKRRGGMFPRAPPPFFFFAK